MGLMLLAPAPSARGTRHWPHATYPASYTTAPAEIYTILRRAAARAASQQHAAKEPPPTAKEQRDALAPPLS